MAVALDKYEYEIMECILEQENELRVSDIHKMMQERGEKTIGEISVETFLNRLISKKLVKKRYVRVGFLKWRAFYHSCYSKEYWLSHVRSLDPDEKIDNIERDMRRIRKCQRKLAYNPFVIAEPVYCSSEERKKIAEKIKQLD